MNNSQCRKEILQNFESLKKREVTEDMKNELGDALFDYISDKHGFDEDTTGRVTGILLESLEYFDLKDKLEKNKEELDKVIKEINETLKNQ